jgi:AbrB family looped-hinge helix DNA binding protein
MEKRGRKKGTDLFSLLEKSGRIFAMKTTIDVAGRLVIPKEIRKQAGLKPGRPLEIRWLGDRIEIAPAPLSVDLVRKGYLLVAVPRQDLGPMTAEVVEQTRAALQQERSTRHLPNQG